MAVTEPKVLVGAGSDADFFNKKEIWPWVFGTIDLTLFGIGVIVTILWLGAVHPKKAQVVTSAWVPSSSAAQSVAADNHALVNTMPQTTVVTTNVCAIEIITTSASGQHVRKEYRGNCTDIKARAANANGTVIWLSQQTFTHTNNN
ncbi:MAG: hypothetical protein M0019_11275 [Actinomycetota bacterium]|nr:hypothetical protein [Actinomycetota bacterium]